MGAKMKFSFLLLLLVVLTILIGFITFRHMSLPDYNQTVQLGKDTHLKNDIHIHRDQYGMPHIKAKTLKDSFFGLGFVHAQDRLWQLHMRRFNIFVMSRMASQGRLSEMFGIKLINIDMFFRNLYILESARNIIKKLDLNTKASLQAYVDGINEGRKSLKWLPIEFQIVGCDFHEWTIFDSIVFNKFMSINKINDYMEEFLRNELVKVYGVESTQILTAVGPNNQYKDNESVITESELKDLTKLHDPEARNPAQKNSSQSILSQSTDFIRDKIFPNYLSEWLQFSSQAGSNAWSVHGNHTESGRPHLSGDPHLDNQIPSMWYTSEQIWNDEKGEENFIVGAGLPGLPFMQCARTKYMAWSLTILYSDGADFWEEKVIEKADGSIVYEYKGEQLPMRLTKEVIRVKNADSVNMTIMHTHHGPIIERLADQYGMRYNLNGSHYSLQTVVHYDDYEGQTSMIDIYTQKDINETLKSFSRLYYPNLGMTVISHDNHIGFTTVGRLVIRDGHPDQGGYIKQGWTGENEWIGYVPFDETPRVVDPPKGYFALANNKFLHTNNKYHLGWNSKPTSRGVRLNEYFNEMITSGKKMTIKDHMKLQLDILDIYSQREQFKLIELVDKVVDQHVYDESLNLNSSIIGSTRRQILDRSLIILKNWDFQFSRDSVGASLISVFEYIYQRRVLGVIHSNNKQQFSSWSTYLFDTFHFKNIDDMHQAIMNNQNLSILSSNWCINANKYPCVYSIVESLIEAYQYLTELKGGEQNWQWTNLHRNHYPHVPFKSSAVLSYLFDRRIAYKGYRRTVLASGSDTSDAKTFEGGHGPNYRMIISMDPKEKSYHIIDTGISGNLLSPHYDDQLELFSKDEYIEMTFGSSNLDKYKYHTTLKCFTGSTNKEDI